ncbi:MAG: DNA-binding protein [Limnohabitans sp.]|nr:DNA-binding protein [Limnohabitans sp.]
MTQKPKTTDQVKADLRSRGMTLREFAEANSFPVSQVYAVMNGRVKATRGQSHQIATALGIK